MAYILKYEDNIDWFSLTKSERKSVMKEIRRELKERLTVERQIQTLVKTFHDRL